MKKAEESVRRVFNRNIEGFGIGMVADNLAGVEGRVLRGNVDLDSILEDDAIRVALDATAPHQDGWNEALRVELIRRLLPNKITLEYAEHELSKYQQTTDYVRAEKLYIDLNIHNSVKTDDLNKEELNLLAEYERQLAKYGSAVANYQRVIEELGVPETVSLRNFLYHPNNYLKN